MSLPNESIKQIENTIKSCLLNKFQNFKPEANNMPFHFRLLGKDRMALYSFIHSLNTSFGTSIFEPVAVALAKTRFAEAHHQYVVGNQISQEAQKVIQDIINDLSVGGSNSNEAAETEKIRAASQKGKMNALKVVKADLFMQDKRGTIYLFDLKTAKPNASGFKDHKRTLLEWRAITFAQNPQADVKSLIAIPYNPYEPQPYERWTMKGMLDLQQELKVASEFWDFLGGQGAYEDILNCFERVGIELRPEIDGYFKKFKN